MYLYFNAYPWLFTSNVLDYIGVGEIYRAFERMPNFDISDIMLLLQNSMDSGHYEVFAESATSYLTYEEKFSLSEQYIYGSKRLGIKRGVKQIQSHSMYYESGNWYPGEVNFLADPVPAYVANAGGLVDASYPNDDWLANGKIKYPNEATYTRKLGLKEYELTNHLGNVQATILDRRLGVKNNVADTVFSYVEADVKTAQDYYPFGMLMPGRHYTAGSASLAYRYGFMSYERDDELKGSGNHYDMGARGYDPRIGRTPSIDPLFRKFPDMSPYAFAFNNPIYWVDELGKEPVKKHVGTVETLIKVLRDNNIQNIAQANSFFAGNQSTSKVNSASSDNLSGSGNSSNSSGVNSSFNGSNSSSRYIYTSDAGWLDMRHFFAASDKTSSGLSVEATLSLGELVEQYQDYKKQGSAWSYEDLQSNLQGANFGEEFDGLEGEDFYKALENRLNELGAGTIEDAPNKNDIPEDKSRAHGEVPQNKTYTPIYTSGSSGTTGTTTNSEEDE